MAVGVYSVLNRAGLSIVCLTGQGCLLCGFWDTEYLICVSHGSGCLFCAQHGRGVYFGPPGTQGIWLYVHHMAVGVYLVPYRAGVFIVCLVGQGCLLCAYWYTWYLIYSPHVGGCLFCASWDTGYLISASHGSGCLFCAQQGRGIYCVSHRKAMSIVCFLGHRVSNMCLTWQWVSILCPTWQGCLLCAFWCTGGP